MPDSEELSYNLLGVFVVLVVLLLLCKKRLTSWMAEGAEDKPAIDLSKLSEREDEGELRRLQHYTETGHKADDDKKLHIYRGDQSEYYGLPVNFDGPEGTDIDKLPVTPYLGDNPAYAGHLVVYSDTCGDLEYGADKGSYQMSSEAESLSPEQLASLRVADAEELVRKVTASADAKALAQQITVSDAIELKNNAAKNLDEARKMVALSKVARDSFYGGAEGFEWRGTPKSMYAVESPLKPKSAPKNVFLADMSAQRSHVNFSQDHDANLHNEKHGLHAMPSEMAGKRSHSLNALKPVLSGFHSGSARERDVQRSDVAGDGRDRLHY